MIITDIVIQNIKSIKKPLKITLDEKLTRISGRNTAGKTAIRDALSLFSGIHSPMDIKGLINRERPEGEVSQIGIRFKEGTSLWAVIEGNTKVVYHWRDSSGETLKTWETWDEEVGKLVGWKSLQKEKLCFNIKKAKVNLLIDTSPTTNGNIVDYLCENKDLEVRISNLEEVQEELRLAKRTIKDRNLYYQNRFENSKEVDLYRVEALYKKVHSLTFTKEILSNLRRVKDYKCSGIELEQINKLKGLTQIQMYINKVREFIQQDIELDKLENMKYLIKTQIHSRAERLEVTNRQDILKLGQLELKISNIRMINQTKNLSTLKVSKIEGAILTNDLSKLEDTLSKIRDLTTVGRVGGLKKSKGIVEDVITGMANINQAISTLSKLNPYRKRLTQLNNLMKSVEVMEEMTLEMKTLSTLNNIRVLANERIQEIETEGIMCKLLEILNEHDVCPLCNSKVDVDNLI